MSPIVSVIIPVYNQAQYVGQAIESVLAQTFTKFEIIVVNDGSTDHTAQVLDLYSGEVLVITQKNMGLSTARNNGLRVASGEYVGFLDADDLWYPEMLANTICLLETYREVDIANGNWDYIDETGKAIKPAFVGTDKWIFNGFPSYTFGAEALMSQPLETLLLGNLFHFAALLFKKSCFDLAGDFDPSLKALEDWDILLRMAACGCRFYWLDAVVSRYRRHTQNMTLNIQRMKQAFHQVLEKFYTSESRSEQLLRLKMHAYLFQWLYLAGHCYENKSHIDFETCLQEAETLYANALHQEKLSCIYFSIAYKFPYTEHFCGLITRTTPSLPVVYQWHLVYRSFRCRKYVTAFINLIDLIQRKPIWIIGRIIPCAQAVDLWKRSLHIVRKQGLTVLLGRIYARLTTIHNHQAYNQKKVEFDLHIVSKRIRTKPCKDFLEKSFEKVLVFTDSLHLQESIGQYRYSTCFQNPLLYASVYAVLIRHLLTNLQEFSEADKVVWLNYLNHFQHDDGLYRDLLLQNNLAEIADWWGWRHLSAHVVTAVTTLGGKTRVPFRFLEFLYPPGQATQWIAQLPWTTQPDFVSNTVMNYGVLLQYNRDFHNIQEAAQALEEIFVYLDRTQHADSGLWGRHPISTPQELSTSVQTAYHLWNLYFYDHRPIQYLERAIDSCLATQNKYGGYGVSFNSSACEDIDSIDPLCRFSFLTNYRRDDIRKSLNKALPWILTNQMDDGGFVFQRYAGFEYGHRLMATRPEESHLFGTWFRMLALIYINQVLDISTTLAQQITWHTCPGYQFWFDPNTIGKRTIQ